MVQRKAPSNLWAHTEPETKPPKSDRHQPSHQHQDTRSKGGGGGGDLKTRMKKLRSIRASDLASLEGPSSGNKHAQSDGPRKTNASLGSPNYMKPTSSWDARRDRPQVTIHPKNLNYSRPLKVFSLKRARPSMKKSSAVSRATCSSTLKDSKFPKALDLNPGGTEADGTSVMKVCPYTYCSLNGHTHPALPSLKCFMAARRKLLKTQKSLRSRGWPSFSGEVEKEMDTGQSRDPSGFEMTPLMIEDEEEEEAGDFFVEVYAKPREQSVELESCDGRSNRKEDDTENARVLFEFSLIKDGGVCAESQIEVCNGRDDLNRMDEPYSGIGSEDDLDPKSDFSVGEMGAMMNFLEFVECDQQLESQEADRCSLIAEDHAERPFECCVLEVSGVDGDGLAESESKTSNFKATDIDSKDEIGPLANMKIDCSEFTDNVLGPISGNESTGDEFSFDDEEQSLQVSDDSTDDGSSESNGLVLEGSECLSSDDSSYLGFNEEISDEREEGAGDRIFEGEALESADHETMQNLDNESADDRILGDFTRVMKDGDEPLSIKYNIYDSSYLRCNEEISDEREEGSEQDKDVDDIFEGEAFETDDHETIQNLDNESADDRILSDFTRVMKDGDEEVREGSETGGSISITTKHDHLEIDGMMHIEGIVESDTDDICVSDNNLEDEDESIDTGTADSNQPLTGAGDERGARMRIMRKGTTQGSEQVKEFNPRSPRFLPIEPDPEAEKVDLRHQMMDERRNAEEWMVDYALQQAVTKLAPARKRKVALLVEAFETVLPLPMYEEPLRHATSGFAHARPIQACS